ncbi:response regulator transcription factor [Arthrobacter cryoconiti]|uniref:Response regulator transcription factor n=1 Tax=Arthrobacter cryoconiti TaxID=748907 RepID=A0ABV8R4A3_9MICC|nr:response regulator transcription factor [Arthrobacter cryoconiti]MCC9067037.1 response regulator transcription factor [Arthrobacter cryoconiti]
MEHARVAVVIEDDQDIRELLTMILGQSGYVVHSAAMGVDGVSLVREHDPDLITVDVGLPDIDGFVVTERIRSFSDSHIIMLTARTGVLDSITGREAGANEYLAKPFHPRELRARVDALFQGIVPEGTETGTSAASKA